VEGHKLLSFKSSLNPTDNGHNALELGTPPRVHSDGVKLYTQKGTKFAHMFSIVRFVVKNQLNKYLQRMS
jgi:hypothetical protein